MKWIIFVLVMVVCALAVICYACIVAASNADRDAYEMYEKWKDRKKNEADRR